MDGAVEQVVDAARGLWSVLGQLFPLRASARGDACKRQRVSTAVSVTLSLSLFRSPGGWKQEPTAAVKPSQIAARRKLFIVAAITSTTPMYSATYGSAKWSLRLK